jgi:hypothetical protein
MILSSAVRCRVSYRSGASGEAPAISVWPISPTGMPLFVFAYICPGCTTGGRPPAAPNKPSRAYKTVRFDTVLSVPNRPRTGLVTYLRGMKRFSLAAVSNL